jgi:hypothetical protein
MWYVCFGGNFFGTLQELENYDSGYSEWWPGFDVSQSGAHLKTKQIATFTRKYDDPHIKVVW